VFYEFLKKFKRKTLKILILVLFLSLVSVLSVKNLLDYSSVTDGQEFYKLGMFLKDNTNHNERIVFSGTFAPQLNYYSERKIEYGVTHPQHVIDLAESGDGYKFYVRYTPIEPLTEEQVEKFQSYQSFTFDEFIVFLLN
jgi:hypothetical protein